MLKQSTKALYCQLCQPMAIREEFKRKAIFEQHQRVEIVRHYKEFGIRSYLVYNEISDLYELHIRFAKTKYCATSRVMGNFERMQKDPEILKSLIIEKMINNQKKGIR